MQDGASCCLLLSCRRISSARSLYSRYSMLVYKPNIKVLDVGEAKPAQTHASPSNGADAGGEDGGLSTRHAAADGALCWQNLAFWIRAHSGGS